MITHFVYLSTQSDAIVSCTLDDTNSTLSSQRYGMDIVVWCTSDAYFNIITISYHFGVLTFLPLVIQCHLNWIETALNHTHTHTHTKQHSIQSSFNGWFIWKLCRHVDDNQLFLRSTQHSFCALQSLFIFWLVIIVLWSPFTHVCACIEQFTAVYANSFNVRLPMNRMAMILCVTSDLI